MTLDVNDLVRLAVNRPDDGLRAGDLGVVVAVFDQPDRAYEVEFVDDEGGTRAMLALKPDELRPE